MAFVRYDLSVLICSLPFSFSCITYSSLDNAPDVIRGNHWLSYLKNTRVHKSFDVSYSCSV